MIHALALALLVAALPPGLQAQDRSTDRLNAIQNPLTALRERASSAGVAAAIPPMEGPVDPATYLVGPGDVFALAVGTTEGTSTSIPVSADGVLLLPDAGSVEVAGLTLEVARERAIASLRRSLGSVPFDLRLAQPRQFYVHVSGAVPVPGRYLAPPVARVSSVLELAFADTSRATLSNPAFRPSLRNVSLIRRSGEDRSLDLARYFATGDVEHNPYLTDGDVVVVPGYDPAFESVFVDGAVPFPGPFDFRPGDTAAGLLQVAGLVRTPGATVRLTRPGEPTVELPLDRVMEGGLPALRPRDHVAVVRDRPAGGTASIEGWVHAEGTYPIETGSTTVQDLVRMAGGLQDGALLSAAYVERSGATSPRPPASRGALADLVGHLRADTLAARRQARLTDLDFASRLYFLQDLRAQRRVSVDLSAELLGTGEPIVLRDGDRLVVPRDEHTVQVIGQVVRPGFVAFAPGRARDWYVRAAGGVGFNADRVVHLRAGTGEEVSDPGADVRSGDVIFVDRRTDLAETAQLRQLDIAQQQIDMQERNYRREQKFRIVQTVLGTVSTIGTVVALILSIQRQ